MAGARGPGGLPTLDVSQRLAQQAGVAPGDRGMFLENRHVPVSGRGRRRRRARANPDQIWLVHYAVAHLIHALRYANPGINVRLPSHIHPPFRSINFNFQRRATTTGALTPFAITFNGNTTVPDGVQGVISALSFIGYPDNVDVATGYRTFLMTLRKNGVPIPGFLNLRPGYTAGETITDIAGTDDAHGTVPSPTAPARIHLAPGDVIDAIIFNPGPLVDAEYEFRIGGWLYPIEVEADGIVGTLADRGGPMPIARP